MIEGEEHVRGRMRGVQKILAQEIIQWFHLFAKKTVAFYLRRVVLNKMNRATTSHNSHNDKSIDAMNGIN